MYNRGKMMVELAKRQNIDSETTSKEVKTGKNLKSIILIVYLPILLLFKIWLVHVKYCTGHVTYFRYLQELLVGLFSKIEFRGLDINLLLFSDKRFIIQQKISVLILS